MVDHSQNLKDFTSYIIFAFPVSSSNVSRLSVQTTVVVRTEGEVWVHQNSRFCKT